MARPTRFADAVRLLANDDGKLLTGLDHVLSGVLLLTGAIGLFDPKNDLIRLIRDVRGRAGGALRAGPPRARSSLMIATHTVLVTAAFFDEVSADPVVARVGLTSEDEQNLMRARSGEVAELLTAVVPVPVACTPREEFGRELAGWFEDLGANLNRFLTGFAVVEELTAAEQARLKQHLTETVPGLALERYESYVRELAHESPIFGFWIVEWEYTSTRAAAVGFAEETRRGLSQLGRLLAMVQPIGRMDQRWRELAAGYLAELDRPVVRPGEHGAAPDLVIPTLGSAYVNPAFRVVAAGEASRVSEDHWWDAEVPLRDDLQKFLVRYLSSPDATELPMLVLGHPGSGKSVFTKAFAARLQDTGFRPLRVDLRAVPADASVVDQVRHALRQTLQRDIEWADLAAGVDSATPVIFFDGFDELLQSSATSQADFLERMCEFQRLAAIRDAPVAVVVTSRTVVAHRARIPAGVQVVRLEPFDRARITDWLDTWNSSNADYLRQRQLVGLSVDVVARYPHLAAQPLLLLLLALYDADGNKLQDESGQLADADLYDRLLRAFTRREVRKDGPHLTDAEVSALVDEELERLAIAALAMFNRGSQYVAEKDLDEDMRALLLAHPYGGPDRAHQTGSQRLVGRFFFVHVATARYADTLRTYEFLHATFGEYLVAWFVARALPRPPISRTLTSVRPDRNDSLLAAILSHAILAERAQIVVYFEHLATVMTDRAGVYDQLLEAFRGCFDSIAWQAFADYRPTRGNVAERMAFYSANLLLLAVLLAPGGELPLAVAFDVADPDELRVRWHRLAQFWLAAGGHTAVHVVSDEIEVVEAAPGLALRRRREHTEAPDGLVHDLIRTNSLVQEPELAVLLRAVEPIVAALNAEGFLPGGSDEAPVRGLLTLLLARDDQVRDGQYYALIDTLERHGSITDRIRYTELLLSHLSARDGHLDPESFYGLLRMIDNDPAAGPAIIRRFLRALIRLGPGLESHRRALVRQALFVMMSSDHNDALPPAWVIQDFVNDLLDDAAGNLQLVPVVLEVFAARSLWKIAGYPGLPHQLNAWLDGLPEITRAALPDEIVHEIRVSAGDRWSSEQPPVAGDPPDEDG
ncbi:AAA family ATPase [Micromonospora sp. WMMD964]|uniref:NACHT domain-containing protein n=1 Tax=Micromonospora sp. WMMD964 TaxID=3016091 RepID=UPI00249C8089|nr:AAA family ATPase [Micromonospora sp. WMMD964]WFE98727.1 AAA family ATPase [Micromonospora sp. WMMD964]